MADEIQKRQIACKVKIKDIIDGTYVQKEGWTPNYIETLDGRKISRVNIIGAVIEKEGDTETGYNSIMIEDSSGNISGRVFGDDLDKLEGINVGDVVLVIGRPREYGSEIYVLLEIVKKIEDKKWINVRTLELGAQKEVFRESEPVSVVEKKEDVVEEEIVVEEKAGEEKATEEKTSLNDQILNYVRSADKGDGVDFEEVLKKFNDEGAVKNLLSEGELFEIKPGRIKVLE